MKRTKSINLERMRKAPARFKLKPIVLSIAALSLAGCSSRDATVYTSVADCISQKPNLRNVCESAYQKALAKSAITGPKYQSDYDCSYDFGRNRCVPYKSPTGKNWYMPEMSGYMLANSIEEDEEDYESEPVYSSSNYNSGYYGHWTTVDGSTYKRTRGPISVKDDTFKPKPAVTKTISRGGFGSTVAAKSSWGGSSYSSWGG